MYAGIDFGTSNSSIGIWKNQQPVLIPLEKGNVQLLSALYTLRSDVDLVEINISDLNKRVGDEKRKRTNALKKEAKEKSVIKELTDSELKNIIRRAMRRENADRARKKSEKQNISDSLNADSEVFFGEEALHHHIQNTSSGYFIKSPKSFLGTDIQNNQIELFVEIITKILAFIKYKAEQHEREEIDNIVLGHPVNFHGMKGDEGNAQAIGILESAAIAAGFKEVKFLLEPIAAALDFERSLSKNLVALVLDAGGGTTDCTMIKVGPSYKHLTDRKDSALGYDGKRIGGIDLDIELAMRKIMPYFGLETLLNTGLSIPRHFFVNPIKINNVPDQKEYMLEETRDEIEVYYSRSTDKGKHNRLRRVYESGLGIQLNRSAELAKIALSDRDHFDIPLQYIEPDLMIPISRQDLKESIMQEIKGFISLMEEVEKQAGVKPDIVYVTGGTAKSPVVEELIRQHYGDIEIVVGDLFGSVTSGLTSFAQRIYK